MLVLGVFLIQTEFVCVTTSMAQKALPYEKMLLPPSTWRSNCSVQPVSPDPQLLKLGSW